MTAVRCASGLGDSVYLRPVVDHLAARGEEVVALSDYPEVFIGARCKVEPYRRDRVDVVAHYVTGKANPATTQWQDVCRAARIPEDTPLAFAWAVRNHALVERVRREAAGRPVVLVHGGRVPMARTDGFGMELLPREEAFSAAVAGLAGACRVGIGGEGSVYPVEVDVDLRGSTTVSDLLDLFRSCDGVLAQCSFAVPMAEVFDRPLLVVWSVAGLESRVLYIRQVTPQKILQKPDSRYLLDCLPHEAITAGARGFLGDLACVS